MYSMYLTVLYSMYRWLNSYTVCTISVEYGAYSMISILDQIRSTTINGSILLTSSYYPYHQLTLHT
jgi:hypothetical protein